MEDVMAKAEAAAAATATADGDKPFHVEIADKVAHIRLDRPGKLNAMSIPFWRELPEIVRDISDNAKARCMVISSTGRHFSAGMDLAVFGADPSLNARKPADPQVENEGFRHLVLALQGTFSCLDEARMPVLAAIQGGCIGGAVDMVSACDIRYCTADAFFQIQEINIAMTADVGTFPRLCKLIPEGWVRELAYTGRRLTAQKAEQIGLVNEVYPDHAAMLTAVMATAREIAAKAPLAVAGSKMMINYARDHSIAEGLDRIAIWQSGMHSRSAMAEAFKAQQEKRQPRFPDLAPLRSKL
jgi:enoyl-CoA hydratase